MCWFEFGNILGILLSVLFLISLVFPRVREFLSGVFENTTYGDFLEVVDSEEFLTEKLPTLTLALFTLILIYFFLRVILCLW